MKTERFNKLVEERIEKIRNTLASKGKEYSTDDNKLHNFDNAARKSGRTREQALDGMLLKHLVSIDDIIEKTSKDIFPSIEVINEKLGDIINYYILLEACLVDRQENPKMFVGLEFKMEHKKYSLSPEDCFSKSEKLIGLAPAIHLGLEYSTTLGLWLYKHKGLGRSPKEGKYVYQYIGVNEPNLLILLKAREQDLCISIPLAEFEKDYIKIEFTDPIYQIWNKADNSV